MSILTHILRLPGTLHAKLRRHQDRKAQARKWRDRRHRESRRARKDEADMSDAEFKREWARLRKGERQAEMKNGGSESEGKGGIDEGATEDDDEKRGWEGNGEAEEERSGRAGAMAENEGVLKHKREIGKEYLALVLFFLPLTPFSFGVGNCKELTHEILLTLTLRAGVHPESRRCLVRYHKEGGRR